MSPQGATRTPTDAIPAQRAATEPAPVAAAAPPARGLLGSYLGYVGYFVGAGLISGGIVHYPLDPGRYLVLAAVGAVVFMGATILSEVVLPASRAGRPPLVRVVLASLVLSIGIGMLSGGIAHFQDFPVRGAVLVPLGLLSSFVAFVLREAADPVDAIVSWVGTGVVVVSVVAVFGLGQYALHLQTPAAAEHGHEHSAPAADTPPAGSSVTAARVGGHLG
ncbi:hypothetical protein [Aquipuribacter sp. MA13-6]|uniref:hypothetical protein n=1 Tax=unclassified Aquipuribacter TaxID=2635084 RepID=UPI003EE823A9